LKQIEEDLFLGCSGLGSLLIPASVKIVHGSAFASSGILEITVEEGNANLAVCGHCLINLPAPSVVRHFNYQREIGLSSEVESLCTGRFSPSSLIFEPGSRLRRIEASAFAQCEKLASISILASVESLGDKCFFTAIPFRQ
jgi:hypothetical protein